MNNIIDDIKQSDLVKLREELNNKLLHVNGSTAITQFSIQEVEAINNRLRSLGYMGDEPRVKVDVLKT